ncbi:MAG: PP2C family protein-serine/threonine phosphatase [Lachnospiraceae bacterium]
MRRSNSEFQTGYLSQEGQKLKNRDYFGYVELDDFACYVMADSLDEDIETNSARIAVESLIRSFGERPTMKKRALTQYMHQAHKDLGKERRGRRLKVSVVMVVTDYRKVRSCHVGNSRFYLVRNGRYLTQTKDQSLTQNLVEEEKVPLDQAAIHQERNNLYSYLGVRGTPKVVISPKIKLENGDILAQLTRGIWENSSDEEFAEIMKAATEPKDILEKTEDQVLGRQEEEKEIDNYSLAVTFVTKVFESPKKKISIKQILMVALPILMIAVVLSVTLYIRYSNIKSKEVSLTQYMTSGEQYLKYDNYKKASEEYTEAKKLASDLKRQEDLSEADQYLKLTDQINLADEALLAGEYVKAQELYLAARELSVKTGNVGKKYIESQLDKVIGYIEVYDWLSIGETKEGYGDLSGAIEAYKKAREKATALYDKDSKEEALSKQLAVEEKLASEASAESQAVQEAAQKEEESQAAEQEIENQQKSNDQKNAIELENTANELLKEGQYESAITFYQTAQSIYERLELSDRAMAVEDKIIAAEAGAAAAEASKAAEEESKAAEAEAASKAAAEAARQETAETETTAEDTDDPKRNAIGPGV